MAERAAGGMMMAAPVLEIRNLKKEIPRAGRDPFVIFTDINLSVREGEFVRCAVSGDPIRLDNLRYWSVGRQEPYKTARESLAAERRSGA